MTMWKSSDFRSHNRLWRKNTVPLPGTNCIGVDLNRNFPEGYGIGASKNPCSEVYQGDIDPVL